VLTDAELVDNVLMNDDGQSFAELVNRYEQAVLNLAYYMLHDPAEAEDAAQEAFLRAYRNLSRYDCGRSFKTWVMSIASNHCIDRLRRRHFQKFSLDEMLPTHPALASREPNPEEHTIESERSRAMSRLLETLPAKYRSVVILYYWYEMSCTEIADSLAVREGTVKSRLFRARRQLADSLQSNSVIYPYAMAVAGV
jgi:RNA polymerase sigma-70 factor (ECF subfamily)